MEVERRGEEDTNWLPGELQQQKILGLDLFTDVPSDSRQRVNKEKV